MYFFPYFIFLVVEKVWKMLSNSRQKGLLPLLFTKLLSNKDGTKNYNYVNSCYVGQRILNQKIKNKM